MRVRPEIRKEIEAWDEFASNEIHDLEEYERLKKKFEGD